MKQSHDLTWFVFKADDCSSSGANKLEWGRPQVQRLFHMVMQQNWKDKFTLGSCKWRQEKRRGWLHGGATQVSFWHDQDSTVTATNCRKDYIWKRKSLRSGRKGCKVLLGIGWVWVHVEHLDKGVWETSDYVYIWCIEKIFMVEIDNYKSSANKWWLNIWEWNTFSRKNE